MPKLSIPPLARQLAFLPDLHVVGGFVRDTAMGLSPGDVDLASRATPEEMMDLLDEHAVPYFAPASSVLHGTVVARPMSPRTGEREDVEITTFRKDVSTDGRNATTEWAASVQEDLARRDFRFNAMAIPVVDEDTLSANVIDPFDGLGDLASEVVRTVGDPMTRFREDLLRPIRALRFAARFGLEIWSGTLGAMLKVGHLILDTVSVERIVSEIDKCFEQAEEPSQMIAGMAMLGVFEGLLPELRQLNWRPQDPEHHPEGDALAHSLDVLDRAPKDADLRWAALLHDVGKAEAFQEVEGESFYSFHGHASAGAEMIPSIARRLKFSSDRRQLIEETTRMHMYPLHASQQGSPISDAQVRRFQDKVGNLEALEAVCRADAGDRRPETMDILFQELEHTPEPVLMGRDLIEAGMTPGPHFGPILEEAHGFQLDTGCRSKSHLLRVAQEGR